MVEALGRLVDGDLHPLDRAIEGVAARPIVRGDRGGTVLADIAAIIGGEDHRLGHGYRPVADLLAVDKERRVAALAEPAARIGELHADLMLARRQRALRLDEEMLHAGQVVAVFQPAVPGVETPAAD